MSKKDSNNKNKEGIEKKPKDNFFKKMFQPKKRDDDNLKILEADLIKDQVEVKFDWAKNLKMFFIFFSLALIIVIEAYLILFWWGSQKVDESSYYLEREISVLSFEIEALNENYELARAFSDKMNLSFRFLDEHIYWTNFFSLLETRTLKNHVYYQKFSGDISGQYVLPAVTDDVRAINFQSRHLLDDPMVFSSAVDEEEIISDTAENRRFFNFKINLSLNKDIFKKK